jgi:hypothetical protein
MFEAMLASLPTFSTHRNSDISTRVPTVIPFSHYIPMNPQRRGGRIAAVCSGFISSYARPERWSLSGFSESQRFQQSPKYALKVEFTKTVALRMILRDYVNFRSVSLPPKSG